MNIPIALLAFIICALAVKHVPPKDAQQKTDYFSATLLAIAIFSLVILLTLLRGSSIEHLSFFVCLFLFIGAFVVLILWSRRAASPLFPPALFANRGFLHVLVVRGVLMAVWGSLFYCLPLYMQNIMLLPTLTTGLLLISLALLFAFFSPLMGHFMDRYGAARLMSIASFLGILSLVLLILYFEFSLSPIWMIVPLLLFGYMIAVLTVGTIHQAHQVLPKAEVASAMGLFFCWAFLALTLSVAVDTLIFSILPRLIVAGQFVTTVPSAELHHLVSQITISQPLRHIDAIQLVRISFRYSLQFILLLNIILLFIAAISSGRCHRPM